MSAVEESSLESSLFDNNQQLEESQTFIAELLSRLDADKAVDDAMEVNFMISNMEGILGEFSESSYELQHEINDILESSRHGLLTHDKLSEMIAMEQTRSNCVNGIVNSLKMQIENLFNIIVEAVNNPDDDGQAMNKLQMDMGLMMKSVDSLTTVITSPVKKLDMTIKKIDSELIVHLNDQYKYSESWDVKRGKSKQPKLMMRKQKQLTVDDDEESEEEEKEEPEVPVEESPTKEKKPKKEKKRPTPLSREPSKIDTEMKSPTNKEPPTPSSIKKLASARMNSQGMLSSPHLNIVAATTPTNAGGTSTPTNAASNLEVLPEVEEVKEVVVKEHKEKKHKKVKAHPKESKKKAHHAAAHHEKHADMNDEEEEPEVAEEEGEIERTPSSEIDEPHPHKVSHKKHSEMAHPKSRAERHSSISSVASKASSTSAGDHHKDPAVKPVVRRGSKGNANFSSNNSVGSAPGSARIEDDDSLKVDVPSGGGSAHSHSSTAAHHGTNSHPGSGHAATAKKSRPAPLDKHKISQPRGSRPTSPSGPDSTHHTNSPKGFDNVLKSPDHNAVLKEIQMKNRENALAQREKDLEKKILENDKVIEEKVAEMLEAKRAFENRLKTSLSAAGYVQKSEMIKILDKKEKAIKMLESAAKKTVGFKDGEVTIENVFDDTDMMEMMIMNNPEMSPDDVIAKIMDLFNNPSNSPLFRKAIILALMTGEPIDLDNADAIYQVVEDKLVEEVISHTHHEEDGDHIRAHSSGGVGSKPLTPQEKSRSKPISRASQDMRNGTPYATVADYLPVNVIKNQQMIEAERIMNEIANANRRNETTDELYGIAFQNLKKGGNLARVEAIKIVAPYNNANATSQATTTDDLADFIAANTKKVVEDLPKLITEGGVSGFVSELDDLSAASPTQLNLSTALQSQSQPSARTGRITDRLETPANPSEMGARSGTQFEGNSLPQKSTGGETFVFYGGTVESPYASHSRVISSPEPKGLPVFDNKYDMLITRTYQEQPHVMTFNEHLEEAENPLYTLYTEYQGYLSRLQKIRLASAALTENKVASDFSTSAPIRQLINGLLADIVCINRECDKMLGEVQSAEQIVSALIALIKASKAEAVPIISNSVQVHELYRQYGNIEASKITIDLQMHEFRGLFERINAVSIHELSNIMKESTDFNNCYKHYLSCQGKTIEVHHRLMACKERCERYKLIQHETAAQRRLLNNQGEDGYYESYEVGGGMNDNVLYLENNQLRQENEILRSNLEVADEDIADLEEELAEAINNKDRSPSALLFFSMLHDPSHIQNLQQLVLQLIQLRPFAEGNAAHIDFMTMKKRIQVCIVCIPGIEKLLAYYQQIYTKWASYRNNYFVARNLTGGGADNLAACPLCYGDLGKDRSKDVEAAMIIKKPQGSLRVSRKQLRAERNSPNKQSQQKMILSASHNNLRSKLPQI